ncbi:two-component sensor histidine kinase [Legionella gratiana]|uniref:histidine kinase n=1 Tax=Legionella gratiana TaxID=45066 RepID=A0A378J233_9GAMM|nr:PAS domain S-box protein [Legionella gratiana]KTD14580.1 two-component sensor histidine kinase [Legionella gratiana]STX41802.1 two-component sensor histidine kinase [Legionella gratiana]
MKRYREMVQFDMTAKKTSTNKTFQENAFYAAIIESSNDAIIGKDLDGITTSWNKAAEMMYGFKAAEMIGQSIKKIVPSDKTQEVEQFLAKIKQGETIDHYETIRLKKDGTEIKVSISISPIKDYSGRVIGAASIAREIPFVTKEQKKFELAVEASPTGMIMVSRAGAIELLNSQIVTMFGYEKHELIGKQIEILVPNRFKAKHPGYRIDFFEKPKARAMGEGRDLYGQRKDGSEFAVEIGLNPLITEEGSFVLASVVDITERKKEQERFRLAIEAAPAGILIVNKMGEIELANQQILKMFKYKKEELIGQKVEYLVPHRARNEHVQYRNFYLKKPQARVMGVGRDLYGLRSDGTEFPVEIGLNPLKTESGVFVLASVIDITARKMSEDLIKKSNEELERFAYVVSHDLKAPLRGIATVSGWIVEEYEDKLDQEGKKYMGLLDNRVKRLQALIDGILAYSRIGSIDEELEPIDLNKILQEIKEDLIPPKQIHIKIQKDLPLIYGVKTHFYQLFQNLINNAIKYNDKKHGKIEIGMVEHAKELEFFIKDNGIGIDEHYKEKVFELFQTLQSKDSQESTGIGLTLSKKIVELYHGKIWFHSKVGKGTTFYFTLNKEKIREA